MGFKKARKVAEDPVEVAVVPDSEIPKKQKKKKKQKADTPTQIQTPVEVESGKQAVKATSEIDDIFGQKKRKKSDDDDAAAKKKEKVADPDVLKLNSKGELVKKNPLAAAAAAKPKTILPAAAAAPTVRKKTEDGFTVYSAEELGFNKKNAGGTKLCPFDCDCCF